MAYSPLPAIADALKAFATDVIGGVSFSRIKLSFGIEGAAVDVSAENPMPVAVAILGDVQLAANITLAANAAALPVNNVPTGSYLFEALFVGVSLDLQSLGPDAATWITLQTLTSPGSVGVVIGNNATVRLRNPNGAAVTDVVARLT